MPYYDYVCEKCGHEFEESLKIADRDAPTEQPCRSVSYTHLRAHET